jgi:hypothetical protein
MSARHARPRGWQAARPAAELRVSVGDIIVVGATRSDPPAREGVIVEVQNGDGSPPYVVFWSDNGQRALLYPGRDVSIQRVG